MAHPNEELVRRAFDAFANGDMDTLRELFDQDAVWHVPGRSPLAGDHRGVDAILGFLARTMEVTGGTFRTELHDVVANDEHAVALYTARGEREGRALETRDVIVSHVRNGKLAESWLRAEDCTRRMSSSPRRGSICLLGEGHGLGGRPPVSSGWTLRCSRRAHGTS